MKLQTDSLRSMKYQAKLFSIKNTNLQALNSSLPECAKNVLKLTYSNVGIQTFSGGKTPRTPGEGRAGDGTEGGLGRRRQEGEGGGGKGEERKGGREGEGKGEGLQLPPP